MQIYGPAYLHGAQPINAPHITRGVQSTGQAASSQPADEIQLSDAAQLASRLADIPAIRADKVAAARAAIADGTYETPQRLEMALNSLLDEIG